jgi:hypothetical protein
MYSQYLKNKYLLSQEISLKLTLYEIGFIENKPKALIEPGANITNFTDKFT